MPDNLSLPAINPKQAIIDAMLLLEEQLDTTLIWAGVEVPCVGTVDTEGKRLDLGGFKLYSDTRIKVRTGAFPNGIGLPKSGQFVQYKRGLGSDPVKLYVEKIEHFWDVAIMLYCNHPDQGA